MSKKRDDHPRFCNCNECLGINKRFGIGVRTPEPGQPDQIRIGQHWLEVAYERLQGGEPETEVLKDYGYVAEPSNMRKKTGFEQAIDQRIAAVRTEQKDQVQVGSTTLMLLADEPGEAEPVADQEALSKMNGALCDFYTRWISDGDYLRCVACKRAHMASRADQKFVHASYCPAESTAEDYPWQVLLRLLRPLYTRPAPRAAVPDGWKLVPIEPTKEMLAAGECSGMCGDGSVRAVEFIIDAETVAEIYQNVIAAAPEQGGV